MVTGLTWDGRRSLAAQVQVNGLRLGRERVLQVVDVHLREEGAPVGHGVCLLLTPAQARDLRDGLNRMLEEE